MSQINTGTANTEPTGIAQAGTGDVWVNESVAGGVIAGRKIAGPPLIQTAAGDVTLTRAHTLVIVNKTVGAATAVDLPDPAATGGLSPGHVVEVIDGKADAGANNITVQTPGAELINGIATYVMNTNSEATKFVFDGTNWFIAASYLGG